MILVFGGTTEGRKAVKELEEAGTSYYYSTKGDEQEVSLMHGIRLSGAMDKEALLQFCREHDIRLLIDAAHPFATQLHQTVAQVAVETHLPAVRFERIFPSHDDEAIVWCKDYEDVISRIESGTLLATTGVQTIGKLKPLEEKGIKVYYRILQRESSLALARKQGAEGTQLCFYRQGEDEAALMEQLHPDALLLKESGLTGGFCEKVEAAKRLGVKIYALQRPETPEAFIRVNGEYGMRRTVERLLPDFYPLHSGLTTGTYATAAAVAATQSLLGRSGNGYILSKEIPVHQVPVILPNGETLYVPVARGEGEATVIKDSGDDPDITNGIEIKASVRVLPEGKAGEVVVRGGEGIGTITLPGFDAPVGSPAINKVPLQMIRENIRRQLSPHEPLEVTVSVPRGKEIAQKTFNPRLGIVDGISIVGVSGIIKPFSKEGFLNSIRKCMDVAKASGANRIVINSGAKSEKFVKAYYPALPPQVFIEYGNYIGETIKLAAEKQIANVTLGVMLGKAVKLAEGHLDTHSKHVLMNRDFIAQMVREAGCGEEVVGKVAGMTLARELWNIVPPDKLSRFCQVVIRHCYEHCAPLLPEGRLTLLLIEEDGTIHTA